MNTKEMNPTAKTNSFLFFWAGYFLYIGQGIETSIHDHHAIQIAISFNEPILIKLPEVSLQSRAVIIGSDQPHECRTGDSTFMLLNIAPESKIGRCIKGEYLANRPIYELPLTMVSTLIDELKLGLKTGETSRIFKITQDFIRTLLNAKEIDKIDDRIAETLSTINLQINAPIKIDELAGNVFISPGRLIHLFSLQVGIPIRKYILWTKLLTAVQALVKSNNITRAALEGGFSDAPHFNKTFKRMFGINPTSLLKNSQIIQVSVI